VQTRIEILIGQQALRGAQLLDGLIAAVQNDLAGAPQPDDLTLLTARRLEAAASRNPL